MVDEDYLYLLNRKEVTGGSARVEVPDLLVFLDRVAVEGGTAYEKLYPGRGEPTRTRGDADVLWVKQGQNVSKRTVIQPHTHSGPSLPPPQGPTMKLAQ